MEHSVVPIKNYLFGGQNGIPVYASSIRDALLEGQARKGHYQVPYLLTAIKQSFQKIQKQGFLLFVVERDIYCPNNVSLLHIAKCYDRFAQAYLIIRNGTKYPDYKIPHDITYADLLDKSSRTRIQIFKKRTRASLSKDL